MNPRVRTEPRDDQRVVWVLHRPTKDRRTGLDISLDVVRPYGRPRIVHTMTETASNYVQAAREMYDAFDEFEDGDAVCSLGGDLHTVSLIDDMLRQRGVVEYVWLKHVGFNTYVEFVKRLDLTNFAELDR